MILDDDATKRYSTSFCRSLIETSERGASKENHVVTTVVSEHNKQ